MQVQPNPCPFIGVLCREVQVQTRTKYTVEWKRQCLKCGRELVVTDYSTKPLTGIIVPLQTEEFATASARWLGIERRKGPETARERHKRRLGDATS